MSVIIPTYNYARFLPESVESVLGQSLADFELIIVDDGSTDNTVAVVKPYLGDRRVRYIYQENGGPSSARNSGIREAQGKYIAFLDADDVWLPSKLRKQVQLIGESADIGLVHCLGEHVGEKGDSLPHFPWPHKEQLSYKDLMYFPLTIPSCVLIRKSILDKVGLFDESITHNEDANMWIRILRHYKSACVNEVLVKIRKHLKSRMTDIDNMERNLLIHVQKCIELFPELEKHKGEAYFEIYKGLMYLAYMYNKKVSMFRLYIKAGLIRPSFFYESLTIFFRKYFLYDKKIH